MDIGIVGYSPANTPVPSVNGNYTQVNISSSGNFKTWTNSTQGNYNGPLSKTYNKAFHDVIKTNKSKVNKTANDKTGHFRPPSRNCPSPALNSARSTTSSRPNSARSNTVTPRHHNHNESYVDETLFGPRPVAANFKAPWDTPDPVIHNFDFTDYKRPDTNRETPRSNRPTSARSKNKYKTKHSSAEVDETLFGSNGPAPFEHSIHGSAVLIHSNDPSGSSRPGSARPTSTRPGSAQSNSRQQSRPGSAQKIRHTESFVDETLFGPKPVEPAFAAPWEKQDNKPRPMFCDGSNYNVVIQHPPSTNRPRSVVKMRNAQNILPDKKPVWR